MKFKLGRLFRSDVDAGDAQAPRLAIAQLLLEIARADLSADATEIAIIRTHLARAYSLDDAALDVLMATAKARMEESVSLYDTVKILNESLSIENKSELIRELWQVAYADGRLDPYEEALLRRLSELLYVPHSTFIREKLTVLKG